MGDRFPVQNILQELTSIDPHKMGYVANELYQDEGFDSPDDFRNYWCGLHRMREQLPPHCIILGY